MKRYYFDFWDGDILTMDDDGVELADTQAVQQQAIRALGEMARDLSLRATDRTKNRYMAIEVRDKTGPLLTVKFTFEIDKKR